jgi:concentrative nucleoside transporter, CNT family
MESIDQLRGVIGIVVILVLCWLLSTDRRRINWRLVAWGLGLQFVFALLILKTAPGRAFFDWVNEVFKALINFTSEGSQFVFGILAQPGSAPVVIGSDPTGALEGVELFVPLSFGSGTAYFAFGVMPSIIFFASLMAILYHIGLMQLLVRGIAWVMYRLMRTSGAESLSAAANIFVGQTEAPLVVRPFLPSMTKSELMAIMTCGMATVAGGVMLAYIGFLQDAVPGIAGHLLAASIMSAPAELLCAKIMVPETEEPQTMGSLKIEIERPDPNVIGAAARGAGEGLTLALNVAAMLIAFLALLAMVDGILGLLGRWIFDMGVGDTAPLSLTLIFSYVFWPLAWIMGVATADCGSIAELLGIKTFANEFVAYAQLGDPAVHGPLSDRSRIIATYALCGFANFGSIGILIGGIGPLAPERRNDLARLGLRALIAGTFAAFLTACFAGMLVSDGGLLGAAAEVATEAASTVP